MRLEKIVPDTNIFVSGFINSFGAPGRLLDLVLDGAVSVAYDDRLFAEWHEVLHRGKFGFDPGSVGTVLEFIQNEGAKVRAPPLGAKLPDLDDVPFLEVAHAAKASLITGDLKHYPEEERRGVEVMSPAEFLQRWISEA